MGSFVWQWIYPKETHLKGAALHHFERQSLCHVLPFLFCWNRAVGVALCHCLCRFSIDSFRHLDLRHLMRIPKMSFFSAIMLRSLHLNVYTSGSSVLLYSSQWCALFRVTFLRRWDEMLWLAGDWYGKRQKAQQAGARLCVGVEWAAFRISGGGCLLWTKPPHLEDGRWRPVHLVGSGAAATTGSWPRLCSIGNHVCLRAWEEAYVYEGWNFYRNKDTNSIDSKLFSTDSQSNRNKDAKINMYT